MTAKDIFSLAIRLIGLLFLYQSLAAVPTAVANFCPVFPHFYFRNLVPGAFLVGWPLAVAYYLIRGAPLVVRFAYPEKATTPSGPQTPTSL